MCTLGKVVTIKKNMVTIQKKKNIEHERVFTRSVIESSKTCRHGGGENKLLAESVACLPLTLNFIITRNDFLMGSALVQDMHIFC